MEAVDSHGFRPGAASGSATAAPVLDVPPLRAVSPIFPPPSHAFPASSPHPFIYISPFSHFATQFGAGFSSPCPPCPSFDPAEVRRKLEQDIASREKRAKRSAVRNILKTCGKNSVANGSPSSSKKVGQPAGQPVSSPDVRKKSTAKTNANDKPSASKSEAKKQTVPKTEIFDEEKYLEGNHLWRFKPNKQEDSKQMEL